MQGEVRSIYGDSRANMSAAVSGAFGLLLVPGLSLGKVAAVLEVADEDRAAYGQELSDHLGLARNTIHHHMSKLASAGLVTCTVDGNRVYYTVDKSAADRLLIRQRQLLIGGHWPAGHLT